MNFEHKLMSNNFQKKDFKSVIKLFNEKNPILTQSKSVEKFEQKLLKMNFKIIYKKLGINLSKSPNDNPHLCRIVFRRN